MKKLSAYTVARYCSDTVDVRYGIDEIREKMSERYRANKKCPHYFYVRLKKLNSKLNKMTTITV